MTFLELATSIDHAGEAVAKLEQALIIAEVNVDNLNAKHAAELAAAHSVVADRSKAYKDGISALNLLYSEMQHKMTGAPKPETSSQPSSQELKDLYLAGQKTRK